MPRPTVRRTARDSRTAAAPQKAAGRPPQITVQILPTRLGVSRPSGSFTYLRFDLEGISDKVYVEDPTGAKYYDDEEELQEYQMTFDRLAASALDAEQTPRILDEVMKGLQ